VSLLQHILYSNGNKKEISWIILTGNSRAEQKRKHAEIYFDKISNIQSKYVALHVGLFWGIGTFIIKNEDQIMVKLDDKAMYEHLSRNERNTDEFVEKRAQFIRQLIHQRKLKIHYNLITKEENLAGKTV
jgi:hypothetical protein